MNRELEARLKQIRESGVPYKMILRKEFQPNIKYENGDTGSEVSWDHIAGFVGGLPEIISKYLGSDYDKYNRRYNRGSYRDDMDKERIVYWNEVFAKALGDKDKVGWFDVRDRDGILCIQEHSIYDPETGCTHLFLLPHIDLLRKLENERMKERDEKRCGIVQLPEKIDLPDKKD